jgi:hypothetical protein
LTAAAAAGLTSALAKALARFGATPSCAPRARLGAIGRSRDRSAAYAVLLDLF